MDRHPAIVEQPVCQLDNPLGHQRARGALHVSWKRRGAANVLDDLRQDGCLKARFPRTEAEGWAGAVTLNCAGGIAGGDRLQMHVTAGPGVATTVATQAAERVYRALPGQRSEVTTRLHVAPGATLEWLPQETILFDGCAVQRTLDIDLVGDAAFTGVESLVFGRAAMGEVVRRADVLDRITVRRDGRLILLESVRLDGAVAAVLARPASAGGAGAVATLIHAGPAPRLDALRAVLAPFEAGATEVDGLVLARIVAPTGAILRRAVVAGLNILRGGRNLPRVWMC